MFRIFHREGKKTEEVCPELPMTANYHTHTWRCRHAAGTEREYVERAIEGGLKVLGFSDHTPYPFPDGYCSGFRMRTDQLENYVDTVLALRKEYRDDIEIRLGFEAEYYPAYFDDLLELLRPYPAEYLLLGQHFIGNERGEPYSGSRTSGRETLHRYAVQVCEALNTGRFLYAAHPDLIHYTGRKEIYREEMRPVIETANRLSIPLEINFLGLSEGRQYPNPVFWELAGEMGCRCVFGCDAHRAEDVYQPETLKKAGDMVRKYGLNLISGSLPLDGTPFRQDPST